MSLCQVCVEELSDEELATMLLEGKQDSLALLYAKHSAQAKSRAFAIVRDESLAEDIVAEVFPRVCEKIGSLKERRRLKSYLFRSVVNEAVLQGKRRSRTISIEALEEKGAEVATLVAPTHVRRRDRPDVFLDAKELRGTLTDALAELPEIQRLVAYRELVQGSPEERLPTQQELAELMGMSRDAYQRLRTKAMGHLRVALRNWRKGR